MPVVASPTDRRQFRKYSDGGVRLNSAQPASISVGSTIGRRRCGKRLKRRKRSRSTGNVKDLAPLSPSPNGGTSVRPDDAKATLITGLLSTSDERPADCPVALQPICWQARCPHQSVRATACRHCALPAPPPSRNRLPSDTDSGRWCWGPLTGCLSEPERRRFPHWPFRLTVDGNFLPFACFGLMARKC